MEHSADYSRGVETTGGVHTRGSRAECRSNARSLEGEGRTWNSGWSEDLYGYARKGAPRKQKAYAAAGPWWLLCTESCGGSLARGHAHSGDRWLQGNCS